MGFDAIWVHDHVVWSSEMHRHHISSGAAEALDRHPGGKFFRSDDDPVVSGGGDQKNRSRRRLLGHALQKSDLCRQAVLDFGHLAKGRLLVGVGLGSKATRESDEFGVFGVPYERRGDRTDEYIEAMKAIWTQPLASYKGDFIEFKDAEVFPKPFQKPHPPVWVGGWMKLAAKRAGKYGEGWIPGWLSPKEMKVGCDILATNRRRKTAAIRKKSPSPSKSSRPSPRPARKV